MTDPVTDNPFTGTSYESETPPLDVLLQRAIDYNLKELHTWLPAEVVAVTAPDKVSIQIQLQRVYSDGVPVTIPIIQNVPVQMIRGASYWIKPPIAVGDVGIALFCERSLDVWAVKGGVVDPLDNRAHSYSDPVFIPGIQPFSNPMPAGSSNSAATDMILHNGLAEIYLQKTGKFKITNGTNELIDVLDQHMAQVISAVNDLSTTTVNTMLGPQPLSCAAALATIHTQLGTIKTLLETLKGA